MAATLDECVAAYPRHQTCLDRLYSRLLSWAGYITALPMPPTDSPPDPAWVRQRIVAERTPMQAMTYVAQVAAYTLETPVIQQALRSLLNAFNDEATETQLASDIDQALAVVMPKLADAVIADQEVVAWCNRNGYPPPPGLVPVFTPGPPLPPSG